MGFTDHDRDLVFDGVTFEAQAGFEASEIESSLGLSVDNLEASGALDSTQLDAERLRAGDFDHATIEIWRVNWQDVAQRVLLRKGHLGEVTHGGTGFTAEVRGLSHLLNQTKGRVFQFGCDANLGDARCRVNLETATAGWVSATEANRRFTVTGLDSFAAGWFSLGTLTWTSGLNAGRRGRSEIAWAARASSNSGRPRALLLARAMASPSAPAATSNSPPAAPSSSTAKTSAAFRICPEPIL